MKLTNNKKEIIQMFDEKMQENGVDAYRVFIEFAYAHYTEFSKYVNDVVSGDTEPYFK